MKKLFLLLMAPIFLACNSEDSYTLKLVIPIPENWESEIDKEKGLQDWFYKKAATIEEVEEKNDSLYIKGNWIKSYIDNKLPDRGPYFLYRKNQTVKQFVFLHPMDSVLKSKDFTTVFLFKDQERYDQEELVESFCDSIEHLNNCLIFDSSEKIGTFKVKNNKGYLKFDSNPAFKGSISNLQLDTLSSGQIILEAKTDNKSDNSKIRLICDTSSPYYIKPQYVDSAFLAEIKKLVEPINKLGKSIDSIIKNK